MTHADPWPWIFLGYRASEMQYQRSHRKRDYIYRPRPIGSDGYPVWANDNA